MAALGRNRVKVVINQVSPVAVDAQTRKPADVHEKKLPVLPVTHPLDPLTPIEIKAVSDIVRKHCAFDIFFDEIEMLEPIKSKVRSWKSGQPWRRMARVTCFRRGELGVYQAHVDLVDEKVTHWNHVPNARYKIDGRDIAGVWEAARNSEKLNMALTKRGLVLQEDRLAMEPWPMGHTHGMPHENVQGCALNMVYIWERLHHLDNHYAHPVEGLYLIFDRISGQILDLVDRYENLPVPKAPMNYRLEPGHSRQRGLDLKPLNIQQPDGVSFTLENRLLKWHKWKLHIGFAGREGLAIGDICFDDRPVCYDARIAEMVVPYGAPNDPHSRKNVFDIGEFGFGLNANELQLGCDCKGSIQYLDAWVHTARGKPRCIKNAICIHEEDNGMLWKHSDHRGPPEVRRARRLVISSVYTLTNYEYASYWYFMMDGTIQFEMRATGIINTLGKPSAVDDKWGIEVSPGVYSFIHQHLFTAKLDMAVDGDNNSVVECDTVRDPMGSPDNPHGNAFYLQETTLASEKTACRSQHGQTMRFWKIINPNVQNAMGRPTAYKLEPSYAVTPMAWPESATGKRMAAYYKDLWVTAYDQHQRSPCGEFMSNSSGEDGLLAWTAADRPLINTDVVVWYNFGLHHVTRPEDWPVQPCVSTGFTLHPTGFFDLNPCLDVSPETDPRSTLADAHCH